MRGIMAFTSSDQGILPTQLMPRDISFSGTFTNIRRHFLRKEYPVNTTEFHVDSTTYSDENICVASIPLKPFVDSSDLQLISSKRKSDSVDFDVSKSSIDRKILHQMFSSKKIPTSATPERPHHLSEHRDDLECIAETQSNSNNSSFTEAQSDATSLCFICECVTAKPRFNNALATELKIPKGKIRGLRSKCNHLSLN